MAVSRPAVVLAGLISVASLGPTEARAQDPSADLRAAERAYEGLRYEDAVRLADRALKAGGLSPVELARLYHLQGEVEATLGREDRARTAFARWLVLVPDAQLVAGTSPKVEAPFAAARESLAGHRLAVSWREDGSSLIVRIDDDPLGLVALGRATYRGADGVRGQVEARGDGELVLPLPTRGRFQVVLALLDERGHRLVELGVKEPIFVGTEVQTSTALPPAVAVVPEPEESMWTSPWPYVGGAAVLGVVGGVFAWRAGEAQDELDALNADSGNHEFTEAEEVEDRLRRDALVANIGFGAAGACAVVAVVMWLRPSPTPTPPPVAVGPVGGSLGAVFTWKY